MHFYMNCKFIFVYKKLSLFYFNVNIESHGSQIETLLIIVIFNKVSILLQFQFNFNSINYYLIKKKIIAV